MTRDDAPLPSPGDFEGMIRAIERLGKPAGLDLSCEHLHDPQRTQIAVRRGRMELFLRPGSEQWQLQVVIRDVDGQISLDMTEPLGELAELALMHRELVSDLALPLADVPR